MKNIYVTIAILISLAGQTIKAQVPTWQWARAGNCIPDSSGGEGCGIASDIFGNVYFVGGTDFSQSLIFGQDSISMIYPSGFLVKYDQCGNVKWAKSPSGAYSVTYGVATDIYGHVFIDRTRV